MQNSYSSANISLANGFSALCSGIEFLGHINEIRNTYRHHTAIMNRKPHHSDAPEIIISHINQLAKTRNIEDVYVVVLASDEFADYWTDTAKRTIYLPASCVQELEELLQKDILTEIEKEKFNHHSAGIHHELTHIKYNDSTYTHVHEKIIGTIGSFAIVHGMNRLLVNQFPIINNNYIINNLAKIIRAIAIIECTRSIVRANLYSKYVEQRADNEIPNEKELLQAQLNLFQARHRQDLETIDSMKAISWKDIFNHFKEEKKIVGNLKTVQNALMTSAMKIIPTHWFNNSLVMSVICYPRALHPTDIQRAKQLENRIAELEKQ